MNFWELPHIVIAPETVFHIGSFPVTNTLLCTWITAVVLLIVLYFGTRKRDLVPSGFQNALEWVVEFLLGLVESVSGKEKGRKFFPLVATFFIFIVAANLLDVLPGVETIGWVHSSAEDPLKNPVTGPIALLFGPDSNNLAPWIRPATTDLNLNLAMALVSVVATQFFGFSMLGAKEQLSKYLNFRAIAQKGALGFVDFFVGILEIISELGRLISFSFRLFGNIFAGSVLLAVFAFLLPIFANVIFIPFELFVAVIQAFVFSFLTLLFMETGTTSHSHSDHDHSVHDALHEYHENEAKAAATH